MTNEHEVNDPIISKIRADVEKGWFDRFYFNLHDKAQGPYVLMGAGVYPGTRVIDGYVLFIDEHRQRSIRFSDIFGGPEIPNKVGPFSWQTLEPNRLWRIAMERNAFGVEFDLLWEARAPRWECDPIEVEDRRGGMQSRFSHFFQSGRYKGNLSFEGWSWKVDGWIGQRDRSTGTRPVSPGQGVHFWTQAQFDDFAIGFIQDLDRENRQVLLDGAVMHEDGTVDPITSSDHDMVFDARLEPTTGSFRLRTESGHEYFLEVDATRSGGGYLSAGGYGGLHGRQQGHGFVSGMDWPLPSDMFNARTLDTPLTDRLVAFVCRKDRGEALEGAGIFEFAHSRSPSYAYRAGGSAP